MDAAGAGEVLPSHPLSSGKQKAALSTLSTQPFLASELAYPEWMKQEEALLQTPQGNPEPIPVPMLF